MLIQITDNRSTNFQQKIKDSIRLQKIIFFKELHHWYQQSQEAEILAAETNFALVRRNYTLKILVFYTQTYLLKSGGHEKSGSLPPFINLTNGNIHLTHTW